MAKVEHPVWLSIDWDMFIPEEQSWDFGHSEGHHPALQAALWQIRAVSALARGNDIQQLTAFRPEQHPEDFWSALARGGFQIGGAKLAVAESHLHAAPYFMEAMAEDGVTAPRIVHLDAHHDLGYTDMATFNGWVRKQRVEAGNWLGVFLRLFPKTKATLVLSQWKDQVVEDTLAQAPMTGHVRKRVAVQQWPVLPAGGRVTRVFVCRSGAWSPPWHDAAFERFIAALKAVADRGDVTYMEPVEARPWDTEAVQREAAHERAMLDELRTRLPSDVRRTSIVEE